MAGSTLARSVRVQDEAAIFQQKLDHQLLTMEQNRLLWGGQRPDSWKPGQPIHKHPYVRRGLDPESCGDIWMDSGVWGNHVRPMIEDLESEPPPREYLCNDCEVDWDRRDGDVCWNCGKRSPAPSPSEFQERQQRSFEGHFEITASIYAPEYARYFTQTARRAGRTAEQEQLRRTAVSFEGFSGALHLLADELLYPLSSWQVQFVDDYFRDVELYETPVPKSEDPFTRSTKPIEFVRPVAADLSQPVSGRVHIPEDVDLSGRMVPELPRMVERTHPDVLRWNTSSYPVELVTEQRRRRS